MGKFVEGKRRGRDGKETDTRRGKDGEGTDKKRGSDRKEMAKDDKETAKR